MPGSQAAAGSFPGACPELGFLSHDKDCIRQPVELTSFFIIHYALGAQGGNLMRISQFRKWWHPVEEVPD